MSVVVASREVMGSRVKVVAVQWKQAKQPQERDVGRSLSLLKR
jgi:hypothetical protein